LSDVVVGDGAGGLEFDDEFIFDEEVGKEIPERSAVFVEYF
jgi:hypothetical protein